MLIVAEWVEKRFSQPEIVEPTEWEAMKVLTYFCINYTKEATLAPLIYVCRWQHLLRFLWGHGTKHKNFQFAGDKRRVL